MWNSIYRLFFQQPKRYLLSAMENSAKEILPSQNNILEFSRKESIPLLHKDQFSIVSYNILADTWCLPLRYTSGRFSHVKEEHLEWKHRKNLLIQEMTKLNPDIMCFQETEKDAFLGELKPEFEKNNYDGVMQERDIGNAVFFKKDKFKCTYEESRSRAFITELQFLQGNKKIHIANCHFEGSYLKPQERMNQLKSLLKQLEKRQKLVPAPAIICGDFNEGPKGAVYKLLSEGVLPANYETNKIVVSPQEIRHSFSMESVYGKGDQNIYSYAEKGRMRDLLDWMWFSKLKVQLLGRMRILDEEDRNFTIKHGLPSEFHPSDHLSIGAIFKLIEEQEPNKET